MTPKRHVPLVVALSALTASTVARAADPIAESMFQEAIEMMEQGNVAEACPRLEASQRLEAKSGTLVYQGRLGVAQREGFSASPVAVNDRVYFTNDEGQTFVVQAGREFKLLHVNELGVRTLASPALVDGEIYLRGKNLYCIAAK